jgi:hypothetical protein
VLENQRRHWYKCIKVHEPNAWSKKDGCFNSRGRNHTLPLPFYSMQALHLLDDGFPLSGGQIFFTQSIDSNANLFLKYPHRKSGNNGLLDI